ncbi:MAG: hypothetical protein KatS3mg087_1600 [Patescibacteria group bacterium]|nr:MAG: hypothetical protein KatS3mg087_1600 [Patescibacteria group bacterium]
MLTQEEKSLVRNIVYSVLKASEHQAFIFGSQATGMAQRSSDLDIGIEGPELPLEVIGELREKLEDSDLPYTVDIIDFSTVNQQFKNVAKNTIITL